MILLFAVRGFKTQMYISTYQKKKKQMYVSSHEGIEDEIYFLLILIRCVCFMHRVFVFSVFICKHSAKEHIHSDFVDLCVCVCVYIYIIVQSKCSKISILVWLDDSSGHLQCFFIPKFSSMLNLYSEFRWHFCPPSVHLIFPYSSIE